MRLSNATVYGQLAILLGMFLSGCVNNDDSATKKEFGSSVRHMISSQTYEPGDEALSLDGDKARGGIHVYRGDHGDPKAVEQPLDIDFGTGD
ncbi:MAG: hypothetical protein DRR42_10030 [Gammaproteobacteria bacterium]|nr:MAG: hypothetical protein DRR42_10030 [Gammaproteobacteria bacterium]